MQPRHQVSPAAIELIKGFEGYRPAAAQLPDGRWTIGYGHTRSARKGARVAQADAGALLLWDLAEVSVALNELIFTPLTQNQFDALVSFAMNIGIDAFRGSSVLRRINEGALLDAAAGIELWRRADFDGERIVVDALVRRRAAEKALFLTPTDGFVPTPSPVVRPRLDHGEITTAPTNAAIELTAPLDGDSAEALREDSLGSQLHDLLAEGDEPSPIQAAAASVNERLQAILDDLEAPEFPAEPAPALEDELAPPPAPRPESPSDEPMPPPPVLLIEPVFAARLSAVESRFGPTPQAAPDEPDEWTLQSTPILESAAEPIDQRVYDEARPFAAGGFRSARVKPARGGYLPLAFMLVVGLAVLAAAAFWFVAAPPNIGPIPPSVIGWALGLTGTGLLASSIYGLLVRIGGRDEEG
jgi:lysozyme